MKLRRPTDKLSGCIWLPRLVDKVRYYLSGTLEADYQKPFCHPLATDGAFLVHFEIDKAELLAAVEASAGSDAAIEKWFEGRPSYTIERVAAWNELAPNIGKKGYPMHRGFLWILKEYYGGVAPDPRVESVFTAIAYDEGFLHEL